MSYSQHPGEEEAILTVFGDFKGRLLDIGAWQPTVFSNTRALYERGWSMVLVEPSPGPIIHLLLACSNCGNVPVESYGDRYKISQLPCANCGSKGPRYGSNERIQIIQAAVAREKSILNMWASDDALSTASEAETKRWGTAGGYYGRYWVPTVTVPEIVSQFGSFDFISVDCEGLNQEVFFTIPLAEMRPKAVMVEFSSLGERATMTNHAHRCGYVGYYATAEDGGNLLFVSREWMRTVK